MGSSDNLQSKGNDFARAFELGYAPVVHGVFATAIELKVFDIIAQSGPNAKLSATEIASKFPKQTEETPQLLDRMLQLLAIQAILDCNFVESDNSRTYGLNSLSRYSTADESGINLAPTILWGHAIRESWHSKFPTRRISLPHHAIKICEGKFLVFKRFTSQKITLSQKLKSRLPKKPDVDLYNHYLRANFMNGSPPEKLLDLVAQMEDFGISPSTASFCHTNQV